MNANPEKLIAQQEELFDRSLEEYEKFKDVISGNDLIDLKEMFETFKKNAQRALQKERLLRIGIIGQLKRGKSAFLNSLLFGAEEILPKAATPMTAALTRISYSAAPQATIEFYSPGEWNKIRETASKMSAKQKEYQAQLDAFRQRKQKKRVGSEPYPLPPEVRAEEKACGELVEMARNLAVDDYLGDKHVIEGIRDNEDLAGSLNDFVGAGGRFTPIVKSTELKLDLESLKGIEVVDTPGMNDPIKSRGYKTKKFIGECDVVFFLSYCSQFLDMQDMTLLAQNIPNDGIDEIFLIGSLFDSTLMDCYSDYDSVGQAIVAVIGKLNKQAKDNVARVTGTAGNGEDFISNALKKALPPIFISTRCHELARKGDDLNAEERHTLKILNSMYPGFTFTKKDLEDIGNFKPVKAKLADVRQKKKDILDKRFATILAGYLEKKKDKLKSICQGIALRKQNLENGDIEKITARQENTIRQIRAGEAKIEGTFESHSIQAQKEMIRLKNEISGSSSKARRIETKTGTEQESYKEYYEVSGAELLKPWTWLSTRTESRTRYRTVTYSYANTHDAIALLERFVQEANDQIFEAVTNIVDIKKFRNDIKSAIKGLFDFSADDFDPETILIPVENAVERITIPSIEIDSASHIERIRRAFTGSEIRDDDIGRLREEQRKTVDLIVGDIVREIQKASKDIVAKLNDEKDSFIPELTRDLKQSVEIMRKDLADKKKSLARYDEALARFSPETDNGCRVGR